MSNLKYAVQAVVLNDKGEVLGVSRKDNHTDFGLIGGKVDELDWQHNYLNPFQAAMKRECKEETGLDIDMETAEVVFQSHRDGYMGITYLIKDWSGEIKYDEPHDVKWVRFDVVMDGTFGKWNTMVYESLISMGIDIKLIKNTNN